MPFVGIPYAAALGFGMALFDLIPTIGAILGLVAVTAVAFFSHDGSVRWAVGTAFVFFAYQQIENYVIQPRVMKRAIDMSPGAVIMAVMIGGSLLGIVGSLLALPVAAIIKIAIQELFLEDRLEADRVVRGRGLGVGLPPRGAILVPGGATAWPKTRPNRPRGHAVAATLVDPRRPGAGRAQLPNRPTPTRLATSRTDASRETPSGRRPRRGRRETGKERALATSTSCSRSCSRRAGRTCT